MDTKSWLDSLSNLDGVGPKRSQLFQQLGLYTVKDLFFHFPFRFEDIQVRDLATIFDQEKVTLKGKVVTPAVVSYFGRNKSRLSFRLAVTDHDVIQVTFFNQPYLSKQIDIGQEKAIYGKWQSDKQSLLGLKLLSSRSEDEAYQGIYRATQGLKQATILNTIKAAFEQYQDTIPEVLPQYLNDKYQMIPLAQALYSMHFPTDPNESHQAKRKIIFQEFFLYQWRLLNASQYTAKQIGKEIHYDNLELKDVILTLPFELTSAQKKAVNEICFDLLAPFPMRRLLQGDVGSGKTVVAFIAIIATVLAGYQAAFLVPTEILAYQHYNKYNQLFTDFGFPAELLVGIMPAKQKQVLIENLQNGQQKVVIGTHALIQETVQFSNLGLIIIDEQHRFGVQQRQSLIDRNSDEAVVNLLQMTATPIPRSLAQSIYGDMKVSTIDQMPAGRREIISQSLNGDQLEVVYDRINEQISLGHQVYYVLPLIDSSEALESIENVNETVQRLEEKFPNYKIDALHGQLEKNAQQEVMTKFIQHELDILVATTMVEVGVDVPNATVMVIQSAERFGLAQLHQLRGRVGRSHHQSYCYLIANPTTEQGKERIKIMTESQDGFEISQEDMKIRGMGNLLGREQSGIPQFQYANVFEDQHILAVARQEVLACLKQPHTLSAEEHQLLDEMSRSQSIEV